jgi:hypothetical protein
MSQTRGFPRMTSATLQTMDETYRMLGSEHEADLEREALKWRRAAEVARGSGRAARPERRFRSGRGYVVARVAALVKRAAAGEA